MNFFKNLKNAFLLFFRSLGNPEQMQTLLNRRLEISEPKENTSTPPSHIKLLTLLQHEGRLIDFLKEDISGFSDSQIGSVVRKIHADCGKTLEEFVTVRPLLNEEEGSIMTIPYGYPSKTIKVVGNITREPPYQVIVRHRGWKAHKLSLPQSVMPADPSILSPAEVEINP